MEDGERDSNRICGNVSTSRCQLFFDGRLRDHASSSGVVVHGVQSVGLMMNDCYRLLLVVADHPAANHHHRRTRGDRLLRQAVGA